MVEINSKDITDRLKIARITAGYKSSRSFAKQYSFPEVSYTQHESNKRKMTAESILEYSNALSVNVAWILTGEGYPSMSKKRNKEIIEYISENNSELYHAINLPNINKDEICTVDFDTLNEILSKLMNIATKNKVNISCSDLLDFAYALYNNVCTTLDQTSKQKMINIAAESLISANTYSEKSYKATNL